MADLTTKQRKRLKSSSFALPKQRKYPIPDKSHAINAKARATQMYEKGYLTKSEMERIHTRANKVLNKNSKSKKK